MPKFVDPIEVKDKFPVDAIADIATDMAADANDNELKTKVNAILSALRAANIVKE